MSDSNIVSKGFTIKIPVQKKVRVSVTPMVIPITGGSVDNSVSYDTEETTTIHMKTIVQSTNSVLQQSDIKNTVNASMSIIGDGVTGSGSVGYESEYLSKVEESMSTTIEKAEDETHTEKLELKLNFDSKNKYTIYQVEVDIDGEYNKSYMTGDEIPSTATDFTYYLNVDYSNVPKQIYLLISKLNVGEDTGEWSTLNDIAQTALNNLEKDIPGTWKKFLSNLSNNLWTDGEDQSSWTIMKTAAHNAVSEIEPIDGLRIFSDYIQKITDPSHNGDAWNQITRFTSSYAF
jgi:hypothetical protein